MTSLWKPLITWCLFMTLVLTECRPGDSGEKRGTTGSVQRDPWIEEEIRRMKADNATTPLEPGSGTSEEDSSTDEGTGVIDDGSSTDEGTGVIDDGSSTDAPAPTPETKLSTSITELVPQESDFKEHSPESSSIDESSGEASLPSVPSQQEEPFPSPELNPPPPVSAPSSPPTPTSLPLKPSPTTPMASPSEATSPTETTSDDTGTKSGQVTISPMPTAPDSQPSPASTHETSPDADEYDDEYDGGYDDGYDTPGGDYKVEEVTPSKDTPRRELETEEPSDIEVQPQSTKLSDESKTSNGARSGLPGAAVALLTIFTVGIMGVVGLFAFRFWKQHILRRYRGWRPYDFELTEL